MLIRFSVYVLLLMCGAAALMANQGRGWKKVQNFYSPAADVRSLAFDQLLRLANQNNTDAQRELSYRFEDGNGVEKSLEKAFEWQLKAAMAGGAQDQMNTAWNYEEGKGVTPDLYQAAMWYKKSAEQGFKSAQNQLGLMQIDGRGTPRDISSGCRWLEKAAGQGLAVAQHNMGLYHQQQGVCGEDMAKAVTFYEKAVAQGYVPATYNLGRILMFGYGVPANRAKGLSLLEKAQQQGDANSAGLLGWLYAQNEYGFTEDLNKAKALLLTAANANNPYALTGLGRLYEKGEGVAENRSEAERLYLQAARTGFADAQYRLGRLLLSPQNSDSSNDEVKGYAWLLLASKAGSESAAELLAKHPISKTEIEVQVSTLVNQWRAGQAL